MPRCVSKDDLARARGEVVPHRKPDASAKKPPHRFQAGNKFGYKHGAYASAFVLPEEKEQFLALRLEIARDFKNETGPDTAMLDAAALLFMRHGRAVVAGEQDLANKTMASILAMLDRLKATKVSREGDKPSHGETTPAEWASALLADKSGASQKNADKTSDNTGIAESDTPENTGDSEGAVL
ncbi:MAG TPA: hypothetical protein PK468_23350 [Candidatus Hydrogenedentes bacterium]|nr:hypothetical protein [Candidatus Hydrogenedentota bacterium]